MPGWQVAAEGGDEIVKDGSRNMIRRQGCFECRSVAARTCFKDVLLDRGRETVGRRVLERQMGIGVVFPGCPAHFPIGVAEEQVDVSLHDVYLVSCRAMCRLKNEIGIGQNAVSRASGGEG